MTVAAPPRPPQHRVPARPDHPGEALIKEARQRARRRRWIYGAAALVVAIAATATFSLANTSPPHGATRETPPRPRPQPGSPLVQGPDAASTLLASWGGSPFGWVLVYADGRMIWHNDGGRWSNADPPGARERRLSPHGLDLIRTGKVAPGDFLLGSRYLWKHPQEKLWAEPTARPYEASKYAICHTPADLAPASAQLPASAQALLQRGKQRTFDPNIGWSIDPRFAMDADVKLAFPSDCFEVAAAEASTLYQILDANGMINHYRSPNTPSAGTPPSAWTAGGVRYADIPGKGQYASAQISAEPIYPHGQPVGWAS